MGCPKKGERELESWGGEWWDVGCRAAGGWRQGWGCREGVGGFPRVPRRGGPGGSWGGRGPAPGAVHSSGAEGPGSGGGLGTGEALWGLGGTGDTGTPWDVEGPRGAGGFGVTLGLQAIRPHGAGGRGGRTKWAGGLRLPWQRRCSDRAPGSAPILPPLRASKGSLPLFSQPTTAQGSAHRGALRCEFATHNFSGMKLD